MSFIAILALGWVAFVIIVVLILNGWMINFFYAACIVVGALVDVACQAWIDVSKLWRRKKERRIQLDEYERHLS